MQNNPGNSLIFDNFYSGEFYYYEDDGFDFTEGGKNWEEGLIGVLHKIGYMPRNFNC